MKPMCQRENNFSLFSGFRYNTYMAEIYIERSMDSPASLTNLLKAKGYKVENKVIEQKIIESNYTISHILGVPLATKLFYYKRLRIVEDQPKKLEKTYINLDIVPGLDQVDLNNAAFLDVIENKYGYHLASNQEDILIVACNDEEANYLNLSSGQDIVLIKGNSYLNIGKPFEYYEMAAIPSFFRFRSVIHQ